MLLWPITTFTMITGTSSLSYNQGLRSGTHPLGTLSKEATRLVQAPHAGNLEEKKTSKYFNYD